MNHREEKELAELKAVVELWLHERSTNEIVHQLKLDEMTVRKRIDTYIDVCCAAKLSVEGKPGFQIAHGLECSEPHVTKLLRFARDLRVMQQTVDPTVIPEAQVSCRLYKCDLNSALSSVSRTFRAAHVFHTPSTTVWSRRIQIFGRCAGPCLADRLMKSRILGTTWGETIAAAIDAICQQYTWRNRKDELTCVPTTGEMIGMEESGPHLSSSELARQLATSISGNGRHFRFAA